MIEITPNRLMQILRYEPETGSFTWLCPTKYHPRLEGAIAGQAVPSRNGKRYWSIQIDGRKWKRSRLAFLYMTGRMPSECIDHINGDSLDDRWENLREATITENAWNHKARKKRSKTPMGVREQRGKYAARIAVNKRQITIGTFLTQEEASAAYRNAREKYYGEFA